MINHDKHDKEQWLMLLIKPDKSKCLLQERISDVGATNTQKSKNLRLKTWVWPLAAKVKQRGRDQNDLQQAALKSAFLHVLKNNPCFSKLSFWRFKTINLRTPVLMVASLGNKLRQRIQIMSAELPRQALVKSWKKKTYPVCRLQRAGDQKQHSSTSSMTTPDALWEVEWSKGSVFIRTTGAPWWILIRHMVCCQ